MERNKIIFDFQNQVYELNGIDISDICTGAEIKITPGRYPKVTLHLKSSAEIVLDNCTVHCCTSLETATATDDNKPDTKVE